MTGKLLSVLALVFSIGIGLASTANAACSSYQGKVVFNEVFDPSSGGAYLEIKTLDPGVVSASSNFSGWKIDLYKNNSSTKKSIDLSSAFTSSAGNACGQKSAWIRIPDSALGNYIHGSNGGSNLNFVMYETSGTKIVDILRLGSASSFYGAGSNYSSCPAIESALPSTMFDAAWGINGNKDWYRDPDGAGAWGGQLSANPSGTICGNNNGGGAFALSKVPSVATASTNTNFSFTLYAQNGANGTALTGVKITDDLNTPGLTFVSCSTAVGTCTESGGIVTWDIGAVAANSSKTATLIVRSATAGLKTNTIVANVGTPSVSASGSVQVNAPLADWRMDESSWNGTADEVKDSSGQNNHGQARIAAGSTALPTTKSGSPAYTAGSENTCSYGAFDKTSSPARTYSYVELSGFPALPTSFTFSAWIRSTNPSASGQRILVRDDNQDGWGFSLGDPGQAKIRFFNRKISNSGAVSGQGSNPSCGVFCLDTDAVITSNNWFYVAVSIDTVGKIITLYVYNASGTLLATTSSAFSGTWEDGTGIASIGGESSASSEGRDASFHFLGNIDEVQIFSGVLSAASITSLLTRTRICAGSGLHHLEIQHASGSGVTCSASTLTIKACADGASPCTAYTAGVSGTLAATGTPTVNWDGSTGGASGAGFVIPSGSSVVTKNLQVSTVGGVLLGSAGTISPTPATATTCNFGSPSCTFTAADSGFLFDVPNHVSEVAQSVSVSAVKKADNSLLCVPAFASTSKSVKFTCGYTDPGTGTLPVRVGGSALNATNSTAVACDTTGQAVSLAFDANGVATTGVQYADVGNMSLTASYTGSGSDAGLSMTGSDTFIAVPKDFAFSSIAAAPIVAGKNFTAKLSARNNANADTPNFGKESSPETAAITFVKSEPTGTSSSSGAFTSSVSAFGVPVVSSGQGSGAALATMTWSEVGKIDLTATLVDAVVPDGYLASGLGVSGTQAGVGRFKPDHFDVVVTQGCVAGGFTYSGQPLAVKVTAMNGATTPLKTQNYDGTVNTTPNYANAVTLSDANAAGVGTLAPTAFLASQFDKGVATLSTPAYTFTTAKTVPTTIKLRAVETAADSVTSSGALEGTALIRSGRLQLGSAYGSELLDLPIPLEAQYWAAGGYYVINRDDACTSLDASSIVLSSFTQNLTACDTWFSPTGSRALVAGKLPLKLIKPGASHNGSVSLTLNIGSVASGSTCVSGASSSATAANLPWFGGTNPVGRATFGVYRTPLIYRRENY